METCIITWASIHQHGDLWWQHLQLRKQLFVDQYHWEIPHNAHAEWDQYDTANTRYVITHVDGKVVSASRLNPCSFDSYGWSYMIRDAVLGRLPNIPETIMSTPPVSVEIWEATRFTVDPDLSSNEKNAALAENAKALPDAARDAGATQLIALMAPAFVRWLSAIGLPIERIGPIQKDAEGKRICVISMPVDRQTL